MFKSVLATSLIVVLPTISSAAEICQTIPELVSFDKIENNFDGSITITNPKLLVNGEYALIGIVSSRGSGEVCKAFGKVRGTGGHSIVQSQDKPKFVGAKYIALTEGGTMAGGLRIFRNVAEAELYTSINCK